MNSTGTIVAAETSGNITRPPNRSVSAPTGMRPSEPTSTGTATSSATSDSVSAPSDPESRNIGPERAEQRPGPEVHREPDGRQRQHHPRPAAHGRAVRLAGAADLQCAHASPDTRRPPQCPRTLRLPRSSCWPPKTSDVTAPSTDARAVQPQGPRSREFPEWSRSSRALEHGCDNGNAREPGIDPAGPHVRT